MGTTPEGSIESRYEELERTEPNSPLLHLPDIEGGQYLIDILQELNFGVANGFGLAPISYQEIESYCKLSKRILTAWDSTVLHKLSVLYCAMRNQATDPKCASPMRVPEYVATLSKNREAGLRLFFKKLEKQGKKK